jgi:hypothetical protein
MVLPLTSEDRSSRPIPSFNSYSEGFPGRVYDPTSLAWNFRGVYDDDTRYASRSSSAPR